MSARLWQYPVDPKLTSTPNAGCLLVQCPWGDILSWGSYIAWLLYVGSYLGNPYIPLIYPICIYIYNLYNPRVQTSEALKERKGPCSGAVKLPMLPPKTGILFDYKAGETKPR